eukprot:m.300998 g.300998  ORF g.300998 m.300998 type:complete len:185 (+) comp14589_c0_seq1:1-555(+)
MASRAPGILDRPITRARGEINLSTFAFLFSEMVRYSHGRAQSIPDLEKKLADFGYRVGARVLELLAIRDRSTKREVKLVGALMFVHTVVWKMLFGKAADHLDRDGDEENTYLISDKDLVVNRFISIPRELGSLNCAAFVAGIVEAVLDGSRFPARVTAHSVAEKGTTILIKFDTSALPPEAFDK